MIKAMVGNRPHRQSANQYGFTLIEVLIVVVIVGILMSVALPSYQNSLQKGRRAEAKAALLDVANRQEQHMLDRNRYTANMLNLGYPNDPMLSEEGHYTIDATGCDSGDPNSIVRCFALEANPATGSPQTKDTDCAKFTFDSNGVKSAEDADGSDSAICW